LKDLRQRLLATFRGEYAEHVARIRELLDVFDARGGASAGVELDETFRRAHSLKGAARAVDLRELEALAHRLESLLARVREGALELTKPVSRVIHEVLDSTDDLMAALARGDDPPDSSRAVASLDRLLAASDAPPPPVASRPQPPEPVQIEAPRRDPSPSPTPSVKDSPLAVEPAHTAFDTVRIPVVVLDRLLRVTGQLHTEALSRDSLGRDAQYAEDAFKELERRWGRLRLLLQSEHGPGGASAVVISQQVDDIDGRVRELAERQRELRRTRGQSDWSLRQLDQQLQDEVRLARLIPAETVFGGFRQMARDLARDIGRDIDFRVRGLEVRADRAVLQALKDPLMHLIRNAIDHGIEPPGERAQSGKPRSGSIALELSAGGGRLQITLTDDGRGIDFDRVRSTAVRRRLATEQQADAMSEEELARLILQPGFSTAAFVTDLSGRGMGLSVVAEALARLQGRIEFLPGGSSGTTIRLTTPLSLSTIALLLVEVDGQRFGLPSAAIRQLLRVAVEDIQTLEGQPTVVVHDRRLPLASLAQRLGLSAPELHHAHGEQLAIAVVEAGAGQVGLVVDGFVAHVESVLQDLGPVFAGYPHLLGAVREANGDVALALNVNALLEQSQGRDGGATFRIVTAEQTEPPRILVVDDSVTTRTLEKSVLEAHGYRVRVAVDGVEALQMLQSEPGDLVIADVEMPRMDGFGLLAAIRKDMRLRSLPVIIVTSLEKNEHREKGLALGADAYIVKRHFDQSALLETIERLI